MSTRDAYLLYAKNWIVPRWGALLLEELKAVEVERWLRAADVADGTKTKCVMSALFSHTVRWEFCSHNPISSGIPVGSGGERGPSVGVRVSAKRRRSPLVLSPEQVTAPAHHSRLPASQQSPRDQQVPPGDRGNQVSRTRQVGRRNPARGLLVRGARQS
jgi:hypothetical protein